MRTRCRCPPDKLCSERSRSSDTPASKSASSMRSSSALLKRENDPQDGNLPHTTSSRAVIIGASCCCTNTPKRRARSRAASDDTSRPATRTHPDVGFTSPMASFASVDFPQPFGPTMQLMLPFGNDAEKPSNKRLLPYPNTTSSNSRAPIDLSFPRTKNEINEERAAYQRHANSHRDLKRREQRARNGVARAHHDGPDNR